MAKKIKFNPDKEYYDNLIVELEKRSMDVELALVKLGASLQLRKGELALLKWSQLKYPYLYEVHCPKYNKTLYDEVKLQEDVIEALRRLEDKQRDSEYIFGDQVDDYILSIRKVDKRFNGTSIYNMGRNGVRKAVPKDVYHV